MRAVVGIFCRCTGFAMTPRSIHASAVLAGLLALPAACAPTAPRRLAVAPPSVAQGVILAERPVPASDATVRNLLLTRLGATADAAGAAGLVEFVFRDGTGRTLSVVQANPRHLRPGDRVAIRWQPRTELLPAATEVAAAPAP